MINKKQRIAFEDISLVKTISLQDMVKKLFKFVPKFVEETDFAKNCYFYEYAVMNHDKSRYILVSEYDKQIVRDVKTPDMLAEEAIRGCLICRYNGTLIRVALDDQRNYSLSELKSLNRNFFRLQLSQYLEESRKIYKQQNKFISTSKTKAEYEKMFAEKEGQTR